MPNFKITFETLESFYTTVEMEADDYEQAREKADDLLFNNKIEFDYLQESDVRDQRVLDVEETN